MDSSRNINLVNQVFQQRKILENAVARALELAYIKSDAVEVSATKTIGFTASTRYGEIKNIEFNNDGALKVTIYYQQCKGSASSTDLSQNAIERTITAALDIAKYTSPDFASGLADKSLLAYKALDLDLFHPIECNVKYGVSLAATAERIALNSDKRITNTEGGIFSSHFSTRIFGNSYGMLQSYSSSIYSLSCSVIAENNGSMERNYAYTISRDFNELCSPEWVGQECASRTLARLNPHKLSTMKAPVLFTAEVATDLFWHLVEAISGSNVYRKSTFLLDSLGKYILPEWLSIHEYPHLPKGIASSPFDNEGVKTKSSTIVQNGILNTWLLDSYAARKLCMKSTGHAGGIYNWIISHQKTDLADLIKQMGCGLMVTELLGQGVNIITGDYSRGAVGFWIENGEVQYPVSEITIAGNLHDMLLNIVNIGSDIETRGNIQCGSVLLPEMKIAGQ